MKWVDDGYEMKWFSIEKRSNVYCTELDLYNIQSGNIFCRLIIYRDDSYKIETLDFFNDIKDQLRKLIVDNQSIQSGQKLDVSKFERGVYTIEFTTENGQVITKRLIKN